jgi:YVTN family beta-propeller protein
MRPAASHLVPITAALLAAGCSGTASVDPPAAAERARPAPAAERARPAAPARAAPPRSDLGRLSLRATLGGAISPKSVAASGTGLVLAQNMMYRHSVTVYDARRLRLRATIPDSVRLARLGYPAYRGVARGAPVEAAFSPDGRAAYVSNYSMYGPGFGPEGSDVCSPASGYDRSFVYRIRLDRMRIDAAYRVGAVPKVVAATRDGRHVLAANWCSYDLSVISTRRGREVRRVPIGAYPRGVAVSPTKRAAYVAQMGGSDVVRVDLRDWSSAPRSMDISPDGRALYVVNYQSGTVAKLRASDMRVLQTVDACHHPIGIAHEPVTRRVWVACYGGSILVYDDR